MNQKIKVLISAAFLFFVVGVSCVWAQETTAISGDNAKALLQTLQVKGYNLSPMFNETVQDYSTFVKEDVKSVDVIALPKESNDKIVITGNDNLKVGDNIIKISVTSQSSGTQNEYRIIVTKTNDFEASNSYLADLVIDNILLNPSFQPEVLDYNIGTIGQDISTLTIVPIPQNQNSNISIVGNEPLAYGQQTVEVKVTSPDKQTTKTYTLHYNKDQKVEKTENHLYDKVGEADPALLKDGKISTRLILAIVVVAIVIVAVVSIIIYNKKKK